MGVIPGSRPGLGRIDYGLGVGRPDMGLIGLEGLILGLQGQIWSLKWPDFGSEKPD